jgi:hypothetical protein
MRVAEALGGQNVGVDALRAEIRDDVVGAPRRQVDVVFDARLLQRGPDRQIVGVAVDHDFCVLQSLQTGNILAERLLPIGAQLAAALREQHVARNYPLILLLHLGDLCQLGRRLRPSLLQLLGLLFVGLSDTQAANISAVSGTTDAAVVNLLNHHG